MLVPICLTTRLNNRESHNQNCCGTTILASMVSPPSATKLRGCIHSVFIIALHVSAPYRPSSGAHKYTKIKLQGGDTILVYIYATGCKTHM
jgi:hypothetical protein